MEKLVNIDLMKSFLFNVIWLNYRRFKTDFMWRLAFIAVNFMLFNSVFMNFNITGMIYLFIIVSLSNVSYIYFLIRYKKDTFTLLCSIGASRLFIILDNVVEVLFELALAFVISVPFFIFLKPGYNIFLILLYQSSIVFIAVFSLSILSAVKISNRVDE